MRCIICDTEKTFKKHDFKLKVLENMSMGAWLYNCQCPIYYLDEIMFLEDKKITMTDDIRRMLNGYKNRIISWMADVKGNDGTNDALDMAYRIYERTIQDVNRLGEGNVKINGRMLAAKEIHTTVWRYLYGLAK